jgi:hypothetical protein
MRWIVAIWMVAAGVRAAEPTLVEVTAAAAKTAAGEQSDDASRMARLRKSHLAPVVRAELVTKTDDRTRRGEFRLAPLVEDDAAVGHTWGIVVTWDLAQIVYAKEEGQLALAHQQLARVRREAQAKATQLWIERQRKCAALDKSTLALRHEAQLDLLRVTAELDGLTGGLYREILVEAESHLAEEDP